MLKKTIKYTDYNGVEKEEDFFFNLNKAELTEMELSRSEGYSVMLQNVVDRGDPPEIMRVFKKLITDSYGEKGPDGGFYKSEAILSKFLASEAYSEFFMELCTDSNAASDFIKGVMPESLMNEIIKAAEKEQ